ncbi:MAG: TetR/AcrR family transcriptional regulator [Anaerolineae bacterium]
MSTPKADRRTQRTRRLLEQALVALTIEKRYDQITVQDIIDRADVGRSTFYAHYRDKEDLLVSSVDTMFEDLTSQLDARTQGSGSLVPALELFEHVTSHQGLYEALVWGRGIEVIFKQGQTVLSQQMEERLAATLPAGSQPPVPLPVTATYLASALLNLLRWWVDHKMPYPPAQMADIFDRLVMPGVHAALAVD